MDISPRLALPLIAAAQAQKHITHNEALLRLDVLSQCVVQSIAATPPSAPANGACVIVTPAPSGLFAGQAGKLAQWRDGAWHFITPAHGWRAYVASEGRVRLFDADAQQWRPLLAMSPLGAGTGFSVRDAEVDLMGAAASTAALIEDRDIVLGVSCVVKNAVTGASSFSVGIAGEPGKFGAALGTSAGSRNTGVIGPQAFYASTPLVVTAAGGAFTGGRLRLAVHALRLEGPAA